MLYLDHNAVICFTTPVDIATSIFKTVPDNPSNGFKLLHMGHSGFLLRSMQCLHLHVFALFYASFGNLRSIGDMLY